MSRIGKIPVTIPDNAKVNCGPDAVEVNGPLGALSLRLPHGVRIEHKDKALVVTRVSDAKQHRADHGTVRALLKNMLLGVTQGFKKELEIQGVGFRAALKGKTIELNLGFSHPVTYDVPEGVKVSVPNQTTIVVEGPDKALVGLVAAQIRALKPPEPYKGKGIRYAGEIVRRKQGKSVGK